MIVNRICGMCQGGCQVNVTVEDGKITKVQPDKSSPKGRLCVRGALTPEILYSSDRLTYPLIRDGEKGEGKFRRASWDEAFEYAADLLKKTMEQYGVQSLASYLGRGVLGTPVGRILLNIKADSLMKRLGSPNVFSASSICNIASSTVTPAMTLGMGTRFMIQDVPNSDYIFAWGKNSTTDDGPQMALKGIKAAKEKGAKLIVIDPRESGIGELANLWIPIIPGSDGALALAMLKLIIDNDRYDKEFVKEYTIGFDEFKEYLDSLTLEQLSTWCGVSIEKIQEITDIFCSTEKISLISYTGLEYQFSAIQNNRAIFTLWAITGKLDVEGGIYLNAKAVSTLQLRNLPTENKPVGIDEFPLFYKFSGEGQFCRFPKAVLEDEPYPMRALILAGGSPVLTFPNSSKWREVYKKLECLIVLDRYMTEDARFADVVFPASTLFETYKSVMGADGKITLIEPVIAPVGECRDDALILAGIAKKLGVGEDYPETDEEFRNWLCETLPPYAGDFGGGNNSQPRVYKKYKSGNLRADGQPGFPTPSGKFEICSTILKENGFTPYPEYKDIRSIPELNRPEFPFTMTTGARSTHRMGVFGANIPGVAKVEPYPLMDISAKDAEELGIADGEWAKLTTPFGEGTFKAHVCGMAHSCIHIPHGGGSVYMPDAWRYGNVNELTSLEYNEPITGFVAMKSVPCRVEKA
ncbi:molybdopterin-containing oxidoreductase family protein [Metaclostridioides mangenotii]|uniref:molybdopterin-containing oxidoreductase family protein n=1 Tax=Metaclostridioides mangenotii TaxID=1540 RepID=UPI00069030CC|nr:molybdopterin-dependent oxidoreductase [Clostridioides mangenotii]